MDNKYTHITVVLDRSGSMESVADDTIGSFNTFLEDQKKIDGRATLTLVQFDDQYEVVYNKVPLNNVPKLDKEIFKPRGATALLDSMAKAINETGAFLSSLQDYARPGKVVFVVLTDGQENASREYSKKQINDMVTHQSTKYSWEFVYLGANQDAITTGTSYGFSAGKSMTYTSTGRGMQVAFKSMSKNLADFRSNTMVGAQMSNFSASDRAANANPDAVDIDTLKTK